MYTGSQEKSPLGIIHFVLFFSLLFICEVIFIIVKRRETPYKAVTTKMTLSQFNDLVKEGQQLVILDDMILDVSRFKTNHPGGKFVIEHNIGRDISKFFYGGYTLENGRTLPHTHTNIARYVVNSLVIAKLEEETPVHIGVVEDKHSINSNTSVFKFVLE